MFNGHDDLFHIPCVFKQSFQPRATLEHNCSVTMTQLVPNNTTKTLTFCTAPGVCMSYSNTDRFPILRAEQGFAAKFGSRKPAPPNSKPTFEQLRGLRCLFWTTWWMVYQCGPERLSLNHLMNGIPLGWWGPESLSLNHLMNGIPLGLSGPEILSLNHVMNGIPLGWCGPESLGLNHLLNGTIRLMWSRETRPEPLTEWHH